MDEQLFKEKLKQLRDQYPQASFQWIYKKALAYFQPESLPHSEKLGQAEALVSKPQIVTSAWSIPLL
jgi:hypothetical protein